MFCEKQFQSNSCTVVVFYNFANSYIATANHGASVSRVIFFTKWFVSGGNVPGMNLMGNEMADELFLA